MPKIKSNRSVAKRFKVTKRGKVRRFHANASHLLSGKKSSRRRKLRKAGLVKGKQAITYRRMLGG
jgi:large subunit ribosomal protein L35